MPGLLADVMIIHDKVLVVDGDLDLITLFQRWQTLVGRLFGRQEPRKKLAGVDFDQVSNDGLHRPSDDTVTGPEHAILLRRLLVFDGESCDGLGRLFDCWIDLGMTDSYAHK